MEKLSRQIVRRQVHCQSCTLVDLCLPFALSHREIDILDEMVKRSRPLERGEFLFRQGEAFRSIFALRTGTVKNYCITDGGVEQITGFQLPRDGLK